MVDPLNGLLELLCHRYGFVARGQWTANLALAAESLGRTHGVSTEEIIERALTDQEMQRELVGYLAVDESYFFRHGRQFDILAEHLEKRLSGSPDGEPIIIWSAGCADGQEPYSIAMTLLERLRGADLPRISIIATDMNRQAIARAQKGVYTDWSFRGMDKQRRSRYFKPCADNNFALCEEVRFMVTFYCMSIQEHAAFLAPSSVECIFFRNVGIYLQPQAQAHIHQRFFSSLHKSGLLFLAPSDAMPARSLFTWDRGSLTSVYTPNHDEEASPWAVMQEDPKRAVAEARPGDEGPPAVQTGDVLKYKDENQQAELAKHRRNKIPF